MRFSRSSKYSSTHHLAFQERSQVLKLALSFYEEYHEKSLLCQEMTNVFSLQQQYYNTQNLNQDFLCKTQQPFSFQRLQQFQSFNLQLFTKSFEFRRPHIQLLFPINFTGVFVFSKSFFRSSGHPVEYSQKNILLPKFFQIYYGVKHFYSDWVDNNGAFTFYTNNSYIKLSNFYHLLPLIIRARLKT